MPLPNNPNTLGVLQALQSIIVNEALVTGSSPFATLSASDQARFGASKAVFVGRMKDFKDAYLPQCALYVAEAAEREQPVEVMGYAGRVYDDLEITVQAFADLRTDWYAGEQKIFQLRDALWPALLRHTLLGATVATVIDSDAIEGRGFCYETIGGVEYRCYEALVLVRQTWTISGGVTQ
jgi:hypothetical protein